MKYLGREMRTVKGDCEERKSKRDDGRGRNAKEIMP